jgi:hypothetical protein
MLNKFHFLIFIYFISNNVIFSLKESQNKLDIKYNTFSFIPEFSDVKNIGRFFIENGITYLAQSGSALEFYVTAKYAEIVLAGDGFSIYHDDFEKPRYAIYVDDNLLLDSKMSEKNKTIILLDNETEKNIKVKIILLSEAFFGCVGIKNIIAISSYPKDEIIKSTENKKYKIEFIGDSITCGYGNEAPAPNQLFDTKTQNFEKSYAYLSAKELDFDYSVICYSGCGIISTGNKMYEKYTKVNIIYYNKEWDFDKYNSDIVVINLGTNDFGYISEFRIDEYCEKYAEFLKLVREKNPNAFIICIIGMMGCEDLLFLINRAIGLVDDDKIYAFLFPEQRIQDGIGAQYHPNVVSHAKWGKLLAQIIKEVIDNNNN